MVYDLIVSPEAEADLSGSFLWYEEKRKGLGFDFLLQVDAGLRFLSRNPKANEIRYKTVRVQLIKRFPFKIIYVVKEQSVIVLAILHEKRGGSLEKKRTRAS